MDHPIKRKIGKSLLELIRFNSRGGDNLARVIYYRMTKNDVKNLLQLIFAQ
jgi:hypothetical protein